MGSGIAAHVANAGIPVVLLDIVPPKLSDEEKKSKAARDGFATGAIDRLKKGKGAAAGFMHVRSAQLVTCGNFDDDLGLVAGCDLIVEAVVERLDIKRALFDKLEKLVAPGTIIASNTSGLRIVDMLEGRTAEFRANFMVTHFFNPPRYMKLLELVAGPDTSADAKARAEKFGRDLLGKGIVWAKDTPNFIGNRIGVHSMMSGIHLMLERGLTPEDVDAITGVPMGHPKSASFRTADVVGLDTLGHVVDNCHKALTADEDRAVFELPAFIRGLIEKGILGDKSKGGFYKKVGPDLHTLDPKTLAYRPKGGDEAIAKACKGIAKIEDVGERLRKLVATPGVVGEFAWTTLSRGMAYAARRIPEITDSVEAIDNAMKWGYNWEVGPFETWDALGFRAVTERLRQEKYPLPAWVDALYAAGADALYREVDGVRCSPTSTPGGFAPVPGDARAFDFEILRRTGREVRRNPGASLLDLGDGVLCLEFHSKMNAIGQDHLNMIMTACTEAEKNWQALVVANPSENFSAGANLMMLMMEAAEGNWEDIDLIVRAFQAACGRLEHCGVPVVTAPAGLALRSEERRVGKECRSRWSPYH